MESEIDIYNVILEESNDEVKVLMILGLESLYNLPQFWTSANYMHKEFFNNFSFPLVLWLNNDVYQQMIQLGSDFENWATTITFLSCLFQSSSFFRFRVLCAISCSSSEVSGAK